VIVIVIYGSLMMTGSANGVSKFQDESHNGNNDSWVIMFRKPIKREGSGEYLVFVLVSFALSVSVTRLFLSLSGYPQVGSGELHIAHVLWGGLLLFCATLLPLLLSNRNVYKATAILAGIGSGLFIDEVGKFITQRNDYFYPAAAPIIYIFFMLTLLLLLQVRRQEKTTVRADLSRALETLQDWIYSPLNTRDQDLLLERLKNISDRTNTEILASLATSVFSIVKKDPRPAPIERSPRWEIYSRRLTRWFSEHKLRLSLAIGFVIMALIAFKNPAGAILAPYLPPSWGPIIIGTHSGRWFGSESAPGLYQARVTLEVVLGSLLLSNSILLFLRKTRIGIPIGIGVLLFYLAVIDILLFYFEQFSTIMFVTYQFLLLMGLIYYRSRFQSDQVVLD
jgi:hypothetical protein